MRYSIANTTARSAAAHSWMRLLVRTAFACVALVAVLPLHAQDSTTVPLGAQLRVRVDSANPWQRGRFGGVSSDTLLLRSRSSPSIQRFPLSTLQQIDIRERDADAHRSNAMLGVILGAAAGVLAVHLDVRQCEIRHPHSDGPRCAIGYTMTPVVALLGAGVGAVIGGSWPANRWRPVVLVAPATRRTARRSPHYAHPRPIVLRVQPA